MINAIKIIKKTAIVEPIPQSCVTKKCCSIAVPSVMTRFPAIKRVIIKRDKAGMNTAWQPDFTPSNVNGKMTRRNVVQPEAPKSLEAVTSYGFNSSNAL